MANSAPILDRLFSLEGKTALITGASGGIGQVLAVALAEAGAIRRFGSIPRSLPQDRHSNWPIQMVQPSDSAASVFDVLLSHETP